ncbi:MAG TPA: hypothetical protein VF088_07925 [Pyrinomonadaceae bacterium]
MLKSIVGVIVGIVTWFVVATVVNWILRAALAGYSVAEVSMNFTLTMMILRLVLGLVSSLCAGFVCAAIARRSKAAPKIVAAIMVVLFLPVHYMLWAKFPIWYHLFFLMSLAPTVLIGAHFAGRQRFTRS